MFNRKPLPTLAITATPQSCDWKSIICDWRSQMFSPYIYIHTYIHILQLTPCAHSLSTRGLWTTIDWTWTIQTSSIARVSINTQQLLLGDLVLIGAFAMILNIYSYNIIHTTSHHHNVVCCVACIYISRQGAFNWTRRDTRVIQQRTTFANFSPAPIWHYCVHIIYTTFTFTKHSHSTPINWTIASFNLKHIPIARTCGVYLIEQGIVYATRPQFRLEFVFARSVVVVVVIIIIEHNAIIYRIRAVYTVYAVRVKEYIEKKLQ